MKLKDIISPFSAWKNIVLEPVTIKDPLNERPGAARYRGFHKNDIEKCIGCGTCEMICENEAIDMVEVANIQAKNGDSGLRPLVDYGRCCWCALCVDICTTNSLTMSNEYTWVDNDPEVFRYVPGVDKKDWDNSELGWTKPEYSLYEEKRVDMEEMKPEERGESFLEIVKGYSKDQAQKEADRCVSCGICVSTCPAHMDIPGYIKSIRDDNMEEGLRLLYDTNPLPEICGRVCTHRCEEVCSVGIQGEPLAIRWLKRYIADQVPFENYKEILGHEQIETNGKKIGIIGAGPAGLSAAYYLRTRGYEVTIYEAKEKGGGMTMYGIPKYRLPMEILDSEIGYMEKIGVEFKFGTTVGKNIQFKEIYDSFDAVFVGIGFEKPYVLAIKGEEAEGSVQAINYLREINKGNMVDLGNKVVVIGGGNVALDAARVSNRYADEVTILYRRRVEDMPADIEEIEGAEEEKVIFAPQAIPVEIHADEHGKVKGITYLKAHMEASEKGGRPRPVPIEGSETFLEATAIIGAVGQEAEYSFIPDEMMEKLELNRGRMVTSAKRQTSIEKIFAGGDAVNNTADAISAIADGYRACEGIEEFLNK